MSRRPGLGGGCLWFYPVLGCSPYLVGGAEGAGGVCAVGLTEQGAS